MSMRAQNCATTESTLPMMKHAPHTTVTFNQLSHGTLPGHMGIQIVSVQGAEITAEMPVEPHLLAPNGYLHAGSVVTLADTTAGYGCINSLPPGASGFTTIELKSNHLSTAREGVVFCVATPVHIGKTTQVWDALVKNKATGQTIAIFRCTQMILYPKK